MMVLRRLYSKRAPSLKISQQAKDDPGIGRQKKILQELPEEMDITDFDDLESDFMSVHKSHKEHFMEMEARKEKEKYLIVRQKYFKEKFPNFLTWHDKEQIRYLYNTNREEWNIERLSEGFPALPEVIEKIVKNKWTKKNHTKISNHDKTVLQNWQDFKQGKLNNLPQELKEHLQKFSKRSLNLEPFQNSEGKSISIHSESKQKTTGEFSEIIASYQRLKEKQDETDKLITQTSVEPHRNTINFGDNMDDSKKFKKIKGQKLLTFTELQKKVEQKLSKGQEISVQEKLLTEATFPKKEDTSIIEIKQEDIPKILDHRYEANKNQVGYVKKTPRDMSHLIYPPKIVIPDKIYKQGYTYKLNDCYYASDGEFLYRVPGMG